MTGRQEIYLFVCLFTMRHGTRTPRLDTYLCRYVLAKQKTIFCAGNPTCMVLEGKPRISVLRNRKGREVDGSRYASMSSAYAVEYQS
jgi:Uma2 family endonuclease